MDTPSSIETLNDLFAALFRPAEGGQPVIRQPKRPLREALFALFFPDALVDQYADKSKSNLTWFFTSDARNKSVRRSLIALMRQDAAAVTAETHRKCREALWPRPGHAVFDAAALCRVLEGVRVPGALDARLHIVRAWDDGTPGRLQTFFGADEAAALSRVILTLAVAGDAPAEVLDAIWRGDAAGDCGFMDGDDSLSGRIRRCRMLDLQGRHDRAFEGFEAVARQLDRPAQTVDESILYCRLGEMLFDGEGCARNEKAAQGYDRLGCLDENPRSWYQLGEHISGPEARQAMERAAELGYGPALRRLGMAWYGGSARLACARSTDAAKRWFQRGMSVPGADGAYCAYMLGQIHEAQGERDAAVNAYRIAQERGSAEAAEKLARLDWMLLASATDAAARKPDGAGPGYCLANGADGCNRLFLKGLGEGWTVTVCAPTPAEAAPGDARLTDRAPEEVLGELSRKVFWGGAPQFPELLIALMSDDRQRNLLQAAALLGALQRLAGSLGERAWDLVDRVRMYVLADRDDGATLLDAAFAGMGRLYFRVRLCDPAQDAADQLLSVAPLFLPRLRAAGDAPVRLKVIGCGDAAMAVLRRALALPMPARFSADVYGEDAEGMERRFHRLCPGIRGGGEALFDALPGFHACRFEALAEDADDLWAGDYYVVAAGDDALNLRLGAQLRAALTRRNLDADRQPFIAVHTADPVARGLAGGLAGGPDAIPAAWRGQCELFPFGALDMYAPRQLQDDPLESRARQAHMLFIGLPNTRDARHAAMDGYYRRQQDRDDARATALSLVYRMHLAGLSLPGWRLYGVPEEARRLGADYTRWLKSDDHLQIALRDEHRRRCRGKLVSGWVPASLEDVAAYVRMGNPGHILHPAKLDPFIRPWEDVEDGTLLGRVRDIVRARFPEKSVPDPRRDEEMSLRDTEPILDGGI